MAKSEYPRGTPFKPPAEGIVPESGLLEARLREIQQRETQLQRWMIRVAVGTVIVVVVTVGTGVFFVHRALARTEPAGTAKADAPAKETKPAAAIRPQEVLPVPRDPAPREPGATPRERALEALGGLTAAHVYQSYLNIGMLADAAENEVYGTDDAKKLLTTILAWIENVDQQLKSLAEANLEPDDQKRVTQVRELSGLLRAQAKELRAYWDVPESDTDGKKDHEMKFHKAREAAWSGIKELLGIKDE
jgi:hypothetical protein